MKFKRFSILLTLMLTFSTFFTSFAFANENVEKPNLVALGDSITYGWNLDDTNGNTKKSSKSFPNLILEQGFFNVTNISGGGWTSSNILAQVNDPANEAAIQNADVFTLNIGSNDLMGAVGLKTIIDNGTPVDPAALQPKVEIAAAQLGQNLQSIFGKIRSLNTDAPIILYNIYNPFGPSTDNQFNAFLHSIGGQIVTGVNTNIISPFSNVPGTFVANAKTVFDNNQTTYIIPGDIHPTSVGQAVLAGLATEILIPLLPEEPTVELTPAPTEETTGPVTIEVLTNAEEVLSMMWLEGTLTTDNFYNEDGFPIGTAIIENKFEVTKNGTYTIYILDGNGIEVVHTITIENIKEKTPAENPTPTPPVKEPTPTPTPVSTTPAPTPAVKATGYVIPNTASPAYNFVAIGSVILLAGFVTLQIQKRRRQGV
ncbi:GDSL-type esterase/lipase family protein [Neobacillus vireti]|uniref:GDSL-type esterase/lipase family protein n=1 Tax=Neobacillus vireti TaxID=220686 RepID=UPI002FFDF40D